MVLDLRSSKRLFQPLIPDRSYGAINGTLHKLQLRHAVFKMSLSPGDDSHAVDVDGYVDHDGRDSVQVQGVPGQV